MGTNFFLESKIPEVVYPTIHLTKRSWGWLPLFQEHEPGVELDRGSCSYTVKSPRVYSIGDIKEAVCSGYWRIIDEYGAEYSWERFYEEVVCWNGGDHSDNPDFIPANHEDLPSHSLTYRKDADGYEWTTSDFR